MDEDELASLQQGAHESGRTLSDFIRFTLASREPVPRAIVEREEKRRELQAATSEIVGATLEHRPAQFFKCPKDCDPNFRPTSPNAKCLTCGGRLVEA